MEKLGFNSIASLVNSISDVVKKVIQNGMCMCLFVCLSVCLSLSMYVRLFMLSVSVICGGDHNSLTSDIFRSIGTG